MIECPICHVSNEDRSLFCAECGQRFSQATQGTEPRSALLKPPTQDAIPRRPTAKLNSPMLGGAVSQSNDADSGYGFQAASKNPIDSMVAGRPKENVSQSDNIKSPQTEQAEAAASPLASTPTPPRRGLHSPLLDKEGLDDDYDPPARSQSAFPHRQSENRPAPPPDAKPVRPNKYLRSPLLSGFEQDDEDVEINHTLRARDPHPANPGASERQGRLHSPVLDGPFGASDRFEPDDYYEDVEIDDPNILRSPLLAAKVPLQDKPPVVKPVVPTETPKPAPVPKEPAHGNEQAMKPPALNLPSQPSQAAAAPQSVRISQPIQPPQAPIQPPAAAKPPQAIPATPAQPTVPAGFFSSGNPNPSSIPASIPVPLPALVKTEAPPPVVQSPPAGFDEAKSSPAEVPATPTGFGRNAGAPSYGSTAKPSFGQAAESHDLPLEDNKAALGNRANRSSAPRSVLLDKSMPEAESFQMPRVRRLSTPAVGLLLAILVCTKAFYLISLGPSAFSAQFFPFLVDQVAQLLVIVCLIICA